MFTTVFISFLLAAGKPVAYIDLSRPEPTSTAGASVAVKAGGPIGHGAAPTRPNPLSSLAIKLNRITSSSSDVPWREAVETEVINRGAHPISIPVGSDTKSLLAPTMNERRYVLFQVRIGDDVRDEVVGTAQAASAKGEQQSTITVRPGESIVFKIPFDERLAADRLRVRGEPSGRITLAISLWSMEIEGGTDFSERLTAPWASENGLVWAAPVH